MRDQLTRPPIRNRKAVSKAAVVTVASALIASLTVAPAQAGTQLNTTGTAPAAKTAGQFFANPVALQTQRLAITRNSSALGTKQQTVSNSRILAAAKYSDGLIKQTGTLKSRSANDAPSARQRINSISITRDLVKRTVTAKATFAEAPTKANESVTFVFLGKWSGNTCNPSILLAGAGASSSSSGQFVKSSGEQTGTFSVSRSLSGKTLTLTSKAHSKLRSAVLDCAFGLNRSAAGDTNYTSFYANDLKDTFKPKFKIDPGASVQGNVKGKYAKVRVEVRNTGKGPAKNVKVTASGKGLTIKKKTHTVKTLNSGRSTYLTFNVRVKTGKERNLKISVKSTGGHKASKSLKIAIKPKAVTYKSLSDRYFWGFVPTTLSSYRGWESRTVWFLNSKWAYVGVAKNGAKPKCTKTTSTCKRYTYNSKTGVAKIGKQKFKVTSNGFEYRVKAKEKKAKFEPLTQPKKGAKFATKLINQDWSGNCMITCTASTERIELGKNGKFLWTRSSVGSWPGLGSNWAIIPPDQRGTYKVISKGRIEFRYANGSKKRFRIGVMRDVRGKDSPQGEGLVIGKTNFYRD